MELWCIITDNICLYRCVFDSCACDQGGDCECLCTVFSAYAQECNAKGVPIKWRHQDICREYEIHVLSGILRFLFILVYSDKTVDM